MESQNLSISSIVDMCLDDEQYGYDDLDGNDRQALCAAILENMRKEKTSYAFENIMSEMLEDHFANIGDVLIHSLECTNCDDKYTRLGEFLCDIAEKHLEDKINSYFPNKEDYLEQRQWDNCPPDSFLEAQSYSEIRGI